MRKVMIVLCCAAFVACSNQKEVILQTASRPRLQWDKDTVRIREQDWTNVNATGNGKLVLYCSDPVHLLNLQLDDTSSLVHLLYRGVEIRSGESIPVMDSVQLYCVADAAGLYELTLWLTDRLGRGDNKKLYIRSAANEAPVAKFLLRDESSPLAQSWNYLFDGSASTDEDGVITEYHYVVNGQPLVSNQPLFHWTFHSRGTHTVSLFVVDELGKKSQTYTQNLTIQ